MDGARLPELLRAESSRRQTRWFRGDEAPPSMPKEPRPVDPTVHEETDDPKYADDRMFYKVEKWTRDGTKVDRMLSLRQFAPNAGAQRGRSPHIAVVLNSMPLAS
jgi:hypothetical protein